MRKIIYFLVGLTFVIVVLTGCQSVTATSKQYYVCGTITGCYHSDEVTEPVYYDNELLRTVIYPEKNCVYVSCNGTLYTINDKNTYNKFNASVGEYVLCILNKYTYDDSESDMKLVRIVKVIDDADFVALEDQMISCYDETVEVAK